MSSSSYHVRKKKSIELVKASAIGNITIKPKDKTTIVPIKILNTFIAAILNFTPAILARFIISRHV